jgi:hypothetical protein
MFHYDLCRQFAFMRDMEEHEIAETIIETLADEWRGYELSWEDWKAEMCADDVTEEIFLEEEAEVEKHARDLEVRLADT